MSAAGKAARAARAADRLNDLFEAQGARDIAVGLEDGRVLVTADYAEDVTVDVQTAEQAAEAETYEDAWAILTADRDTIIIHATAAARAAIEEGALVHATAVDLASAEPWGADLEDACATMGCPLTAADVDAYRAAYRAALLRAWYEAAR